MKNIILLLLFFPVLGLSQVPTNFVIMEASTGTWCPACPSVANIFKDFKDNGDDVALIKYHFGDDYVNPDSDSRLSYYDVSWYPQSFIQGDSVGLNDWNNSNKFGEMYQDKKDLMSPFSLSLDITQNGSNYVVSGDIEKVGANNSTNLKLKIVITESHIQENWQGETELNNVARKMLPTHAGTNLDFTSSSSHHYSETFTPEPTWDLSNIEVIVFIQDDDNWDIIQSNKMSISQANGIESIFNPQIHLYPNPASDYLTIKGENISAVKILNSLGQTVMNEPLNGNRTLKLSNLSPGIHTVFVTCKDGGVATEKIIIE